MFNFCLGKTFQSNSKEPVDKIIVHHINILKFEIDKL